MLKRKLPLSQRKNEILKKFRDDKNVTPGPDQKVSQKQNTPENLNKNPTPKTPIKEQDNTPRVYVHVLRKRLNFTQLNTNNLSQTSLNNSLTSSSTATIFSALQSDRVTALSFTTDSKAAQTAMKVESSISVALPHAFSESREHSSFDSDDEKGDMDNSDDVTRTPPSQPKSGDSIKISPLKLNGIDECNNPQTYSPRVRATEFRGLCVQFDAASLSNSTSGPQQSCPMNSN
jgi:hypothetical protein